MYAEILTLTVCALGHEEVVCKGTFKGDCRIKKEGETAQQIQMRAVAHMKPLSRCALCPELLTWKSGRILPDQAKT
jgi:hypothetical protein